MIPPTPVAVIFYSKIVVVEVLSLSLDFWFQLVLVTTTGTVISAEVVTRGGGGGVSTRADTPGLMYAPRIHAGQQLEGGRSLLR